MQVFFVAAASMLLQLGSCSVSVGRRRSGRTNGSRNERQGVLATTFKSMKKEVQLGLGRSKKTRRREGKGREGVKRDKVKVILK
jgi:hypothetical protein